ncbi:DENN domain-containing protein 2C isoform X2 [Boleophthalmus pectinirostris]|uniref:DENN domain-containing protein 2C isoform X2 n=1 Tax=Boleophthalmus pectinirostris TaxID=150288 RepID=UPI00242B87B2|nr:DENN domain-containing protein 2C isoform X2 [Boleophthalmus pectinirostris]
MLALRQNQSGREGGQIHCPQKGAKMGLQTGRPPLQEHGLNIREKISQWEGRSQQNQNQDVKLHTPVVSRDYNGNGVYNTKTNISNTGVGLDFREVNLKPTTAGRRLDPNRKYSTELIILQPESKNALEAIKSETLPTQTYTTNAKISCVLDIGIVSKPLPPSGNEEEDGMPAGNFYTSRGFWKKLEGDRLMWEKGKGSTGETLAPPKPQRTFQYDGPKDSNRARAQTSPCRLANQRGSRKLRPPNFPPPPCPVSKTNGISRHKKNRKSFEYEDAERLTAKPGKQGGETRNSNLYHAYSDDNIYEDIVCEMEVDDPYEDIKVTPMCLPIGRPPLPKLPPKPQTLQANSKLEKRRMSAPPTSKALTISEVAKTPRRFSTQKGLRTPQYVNKIETIFDERRGRKRVKNQGIPLREETSGTESDPEDGSKGSRRLVYKQSTLKRRPGYRTLERDLLQHQQQQLFQIFVVVSLRKGPHGNTYTPEITQQFPKMFDKASRLSKEAEDQLKVIPKFCFPDVQDWKPSAHMPSETFSFVLTGEDGSRWFCYCRKILPSGKGKRLPEVHCIVSKLGCFNLFAKILEEVERRRELSNALVYPFMRSVMEAPFPAPGRTVSVKSFLPGTGNEVLTLTRPVDSRLEHVDFDCLLQCLSVGRLLQVFASLLLERRVIFIADKLSVLSHCGHAVLALLYPFTWQHTFVPVLPASMLDISCSPTPFLIGVLSPCLPELLELPIEEVLIVDLCSDRFVVQIGDEDCILPSKLQAALQQVLEEREAILKQDTNGEPQVDLSSLLSEAFVRFFVEIVGHYPLHMVESSNGTKELQRENFRKSHPSRGVRQLLQLFMETQMFAGFIQDKEMRKGAGRGLFEMRVVEHLESYPEPAPSGVNKFLKGLGNKMKLLQIK